MLKIEFLWRELLYRTIEKHQPEFTITELANLFQLSTSVVSYGLLPLKQLGLSVKLKSAVLILKV